MFLGKRNQTDSGPEISTKGSRLIVDSTFEDALL